MLRKNIMEDVLPLGVGVALAGLALTSSVVGKQRAHNNIENIKTELKAKVPERYEQLDANSPHEDASHAKALEYWKKQSKEINESLRVDSLCKKAYFEGAQMVRDSVKLAAESGK